MLGRQQTTSLLTPLGSSQSPPPTGLENHEKIDCSLRLSEGFSGFRYSSKMNQTHRSVSSQIHSLRVEVKRAGAFKTTDLYLTFCYFNICKTLYNLPM